LKKRAQEQLIRLPLASKLNTLFSSRWPSVCLFNFSQLGFGRLAGNQQAAGISPALFLWVHLEKNIVYKMQNVPYLNYL